MTTFLFFISISHTFTHFTYSLFFLLSLSITGFQDPARVQTSEDVARSIYDEVIAVESPNVRHQTNRHPMYIAAVTNKLADPTGNKARDMMHQRFFAGM